MRSKRSAAGLLAKTTGDAFETYFDLKCRCAGFAVTRVPNGARFVSKTEIVPEPSPFDWIISKAGTIVVADTKTWASSRLVRSKIDENQMLNLAIHGRQGIIAGYVIKFRMQTGDTYRFARWDLLLEVWKRRKSVSFASLPAIGTTEERGGLTPDVILRANQWDFVDSAIFDERE